jgi:hypothetical protein
MKIITQLQSKYSLLSRLLFSTNNSVTTLLMWAPPPSLSLSQVEFSPFDLNTGNRIGVQLKLHTVIRIPDRGAALPSHIGLYSGKGSKCILTP